jgi:hypothetical protein
MRVLSDYIDFVFHKAHAHIPYYNNRSKEIRGTLRAYVGKGTPKDIHEEIEHILIKAHINKDDLTDQVLIDILTKNNLGIDCSGFVYHILDAESINRGYSNLSKHIRFVYSTNIIRKIKCILKPAQNFDVKTLAHDANSTVVDINKIMPGDVITMLNDGEERERNHVLLVHQIENQNGITYKIHYSHAIAYNEDGVYGTGVRQGTIEIIDPKKPIYENRWTEGVTMSIPEALIKRAQKSKTEIRRLNSFLS